MSAYDIAKRHFEAAMASADEERQDPDAVARALFDFVLRKYLESRSVSDVQSELRFVADNCDPETDFMFMRP
jgi:hypothetical protein